MKVTDEQLGQLLTRTILCPHDSRAFGKFFTACHYKALIYLSYLSARGWKLPTEKSPGENPLSELALQILDEFLSPHKGKFLYHVVNYFARKGITDFTNICPELLGERFMILLRRFCKQECRRIGQASNPDIAKVRQRFEQILKGEGFQITTLRETGEKLIYAHEHSARPERQPITRSRIDDLAREAFSISRNDTELCRKLFNLLDKAKDLKNSLPYYDLLAALVRMRVEISEEGFRSAIGHPLSQRMELAMSEARRARDRAIKRVRETKVAGFITKKSITPDTADRLLAGCANYLGDLIETGFADSIPQYFREVMPEGAFESYAKDYHHVTNTIFSSALEFLREDFGENPTFCQLFD